MLEAKTKLGTAGDSIEADEDFHLPDASKFPRLNLACGRSKKPGWINVDDNPDVEPEKLIDLFSFPWDFPDNYAGEMCCTHFVEHTPDLVKFMDEVYRVIMPLGIITIRAPYYTSVRAWQDPTHLRAITDVTFDYFSYEWRKANNLKDYRIKSNFQILNRTLVFGAQWRGKSDSAKLFAAKHYINVVDDIIVTLKKLEEPTEEEPTE